MRTRSDDEYRALMMHGTHTAKVATVSAKGLSHVKSVWFVLDGDDLIFATHERAVMMRHLRRHRHSADRAEEFGRRNGVPGELLVRATPSTLLARADIAGY
jgi:hypothetical protein